MTLTMNLIYARAANGVIGKDNSMPWHLPEDLAHFKALTHGQPVIMGRKTWDSLPTRFRPLPGRTNIVITRKDDWEPEPAADSVMRAASLDAALQEAAHHGESVWVIGGAQIYAQAMPLAQRIEVTIIHQDFEGDAFAPTLGAEWVQAARIDHTSSKGLAYSFVTYARVG